MSMLTPPGMRGRKYRITGDRYPRMRRRPRRLRFVLATLAAVTVLGLLGYGTLQVVDVFTAEEGADGARAGGSSPGGSAASGEGTAGISGTTDCEPAAPDRGETRPPRPESITVNVYNATNRAGLAQRTADDLAERGFAIGEVANAGGELDGNVREPGLLLGSEAAAESGALAVVGSHLAGAETGEPTAARGAPREVDLVLGSGFEGLLSPSEAARRLDDAQAATC